MNIRSVKTFVEEIEEKHKVPCYRKIQVNIVNGVKKPCADHKNWTPEQIKNDRGYGNNYSISLKHIPDLFCVDFDEKDIGDCELYDLLNEDCVAYTETNKGSHYYCYIKNVPKYKCETKVLVDNVDCDLIKWGNNMWELDTRQIKGDIKEYEWNDLKDYFNHKRMNFINSPVVSPVPTPEQSEEEEEKEKEKENDDPDGWLEIQAIPIPKCSEEDFKKHITSFKPRYDYDNWLKVGFICYNNFDGSDIGLKFWNEYSKDDEENYEGKKALKLKWKTFNGDGNKLSYKQLIKWNTIDYPPKNKYEAWFKNGEEYFMEEMNKECMYYTDTGDILYFSRNMYIRNKPAICKQYYKKYSFMVEEEKENKSINPFDLWFGHIDRKDIDRIVFNPKGDQEANEFNIWKGFKIKQKRKGDDCKIQPFLKHIKHIWANDDEPTYNYILNWFSRLLQTPWKKNNICLVLHSIEGVGKSFILDMIGKIIGNEYYISTSNLKNILGDFNGDAEGKILVNLNETGMWYDKKVVGSFKEFITDTTISINKKGVQQYTIENYCNTIMTTNEDHIVNINGQDRRFNILECNNKKYDKEYYNTIAKTNLQDLADFFYSRDISNYDSRDFVKSDLHLQQVKKNMDSVELFYTEYLEGDLMGNGYDVKNPWFDKHDEPEKTISKEHIFNLYNTRKMGSHDSKVNNRAFWIKMKKLCPSMIIGKANQKTKAKITFPSKEIADQEYNKYFGL